MLDKVVAIGCVLLVVFGMLFGIVLSGSQSISSGVKEAFEVLSFISTTVTAIIAGLALIAWKYQAKHAQLISSLDRAISASTSLYVIREHAPEWFEYFLSTISGESPEAIEAKKQAFLPGYRNWLQQCRDLSNAIQDIKHFVADDQLGEYLKSPDYLPMLYTDGTASVVRGVFELRGQHRAKCDLLYSSFLSDMYKAIEDVKGDLKVLKRSVARFELT